MVQDTHKILLVDDHPVVRHGLAQLINLEKDLVVCGEAENTQSALQAVEELKPDLALVDLSLDGENGLSLIKRIKSRHSSLPCLVLSMHDESMYAERALRAGASGYIMKQENPDKVIAAINKVLEGDIYLGERVASHIVYKLIRGENGAGSSGSAVDSLSNRELEVFQLIGQGRTTRQISEQLHVSIKTTESHRARIKEKMGFKNAAELVQYSIKWTQADMV